MHVFNCLLRKAIPFMRKQKRGDETKRKKERQQKLTQKTKLL